MSELWRLRPRKADLPFCAQSKDYSCGLPTALEQILQSTAGKYCVGDEVSPLKPAHSGLLPHDDPFPLRLRHLPSPQDRLGSDCFLRRHGGGGGEGT